MRAFVLCALMVTLVAAAGCTDGPPPKKTNITGTVTRDGKPLVWPSKDGKLHVIFAPVERQITDNPFKAETDTAAGTYRIEAIPPGKYMVGIYMFDERHMDALQNKFDPNHTPLRVEVTEDNQVIDIDLPKDLPKGGPKEGAPNEGAPKGYLPKGKQGPPKGKERPKDEEK